jgi:hypothetical protein
VDSLNDMIDMQTVRVAALANRVPTAVLVVESSAPPWHSPARLLSRDRRRGFVTVLFAGVLVCLLLLITFDLRPSKRGLVKVSTRRWSRCAPRWRSHRPPPLRGLGPP